MKRLSPVIAHTLRYYDVQAYRLGRRPMEAGRLKAAVYVAAHAAYPLVTGGRELSASRSLLETAVLVRPSLVADRPAAVRDRAEEIGAETLRGLAAFAREEDSGGALATVMRPLSALYAEALAESGPNADVEFFLTIVGEGVTSALGFWSQLRELSGGPSLGRSNLVTILANRLVPIYLRIPPEVERYLTDIEKTATASLGSGATSGRYPVPPGTRCYCGAPANGSVGDDAQRIYLCLDHLRELAGRK